MDDDSTLVNRVAAGDRDAFNDLVDRYQKPLYALLYRQVSNHADAAELLQRTFVQAYSGLASFERRSSFKTWLYQIALNLSKNMYRGRAARQDISIEDAGLVARPRPLDDMIDNEMSRLVRDALSALPERQRLTAMLRIQEERPFQEIAEIMACTIGTAKSNYHHAVRKMKDILRERGALE